MATQASAPWYRQVSRQNWHALLAAWLGWTLDGFDFVLITYVLTDIAKTFHLSLAVAGTLILAAFATRWLGGAVVGSVADRIGRKNAMIVGILIYSVATFLCGLSWSFWSLMLFRLLVGLGMAGEYSAGSTLLLESWPIRVRNKASGFLVSGWAMGGLIAAAVYAPIVSNFGWRALFFIGILPALLTVYIRWGISETDEWLQARDQQTQQTRSPGISFFRLFGRQWFSVALALFLMMFASFGMNWPILSLMPTYLKSIGYSAGGVGQVMFIASFGALLGYWFSGFLGDWISTRWALVGTLAVSLAFTVLTFALASHGMATLGILIFLLEFTNLGVTGLFPKYIAEHFGVDVRAAGLGTTYNLGAIAGGLSPIWGAALASSIGLGPAIGALTFFWTAITMVIVGFRIPARALAFSTKTAPAPTQPTSITSKGESVNA